MVKWNEMSPADKAERVALDVMGWTRPEYGPNCIYWIDVAGHHVYQCKDYRPTENIAQAWEVLNRLSHLVFTIVGNSRVGWSVGAGSFPDVPEQWVHGQPSAADAICHAAVLAVEETNADHN